MKMIRNKRKQMKLEFYRKISKFDINVKKDLITTFL